jgi:hypothetical protein
MYHSCPWYNWLIEFGKVWQYSPQRRKPRHANEDDSSALVEWLRNSLPHRQWETAWNEHDMHALAGLFHEDAVWVLWTGEV